MRTFLFLAIILTQAALAESINHITGTFNDVKTQDRPSNKFRDDNNLSLNDTFPFDESKKRKPASIQTKDRFHVTELNGTFEK